MNLLQRALIEKLGHDHGFEHVLASDSVAVVLVSARHAAAAKVVAPPIVYGAETDWHLAKAQLEAIGIRFQPLLPLAWYQTKVGQT